MRSVAGDAIDRELWAIIDGARSGLVVEDAGGLRRIRLVVGLCVLLCCAAVGGLIAAELVGLAVLTLVLTPSIALAAVAIDEVIARR